MRRIRRIARKIARLPIVRVGLVTAMAYVAVYGVLSAAGRFKAGKQYVEWTPYGTVFSTHLNGRGRRITRGSFFGYVFAPLIIIDRRTFHPSIRLDSPEGQEIEAIQRKADEIDRHFRDG